MNAQRQIDGQVWGLHLLIADEIERRPNEAMAYAQTTLSRWQSANGNHRYYGEWASIPEHGPSAVVALIRDPGDHATTLLRSVSHSHRTLRTSGKSCFHDDRRDTRLSDCTSHVESTQIRRSTS